MKPDDLAQDLADPQRVALTTALERSNDVKAKVEACVEDLSAANEVVKEGIAEGVTTLAAEKALADSEAVEAQIQECAVDLHQVTESLERGVDDHQRTETALAQTQDALARSEDALASSQKQEQAATWRSLHDQLTGLPNRGLFDDRLDHGIAIAQRHGWTLAVLFLDLDRFKSVNDVHGHAIGDAVLKEVAGRLSKHARDEDTVCRNGGDEFLYLLMNPQGLANVQRIAGLVAQSIAQPILFDELHDGLQLALTLSIGIAIYPQHGTSGAELIRHADTAMYRAKAEGPGVAVFEESQSA